MIKLINKIFISIFIIGLTYSLITNRADIVVDVLLKAPKDAFLLFIEIYVLLIFWGGILQICIDSGLLVVLSRYITYLIHPLFKNIDKNDVALQYISMNYLANFLSLGSAATPFGLKAMDRLNELNNHSKIASNEMITFLLINASGLCVLPTTLIAIRSQYNSNNPVGIIPYIFIISTILTIISIILDKVVRKIAAN